MPGTEDADVAAAQAKGWIVTAEADGAGVDDICTDATVVKVVFYNAAGISSDNAFEGLNIKVETLSNGTKRVSKIVNKF